jgi:hypothetical protein
MVIINSADIQSILHNGPVCGGGIVTNINIWHLYWYFSQNIVTAQDFFCEQMRALPTDFVGRSRLRRSKAETERRWVSGCNGHYESVMSAGAKAKTVTNKLYVLCAGFILCYYNSRIFPKDPHELREFNFNFSQFIKDKSTE